jgi:hypothetical protein
VVDAAKVADKEFLAVFAASKKDAAVNKRVTGAGRPLEHQRAPELRARPQPGRAGAGVAERTLKPGSSDSSADAGPPGRRPPWLAGALVLAFLLLFLVLPVGRVFYHRLRRGRRHAHAGPLQPPSSRRA